MNDNMMYDSINKMIEDMIKAQNDLYEKTLAKEVEENDFLVGNPMLKADLEKMFKDIRVSYSPHVDNNTVIMIKKAVLEPYAPAEFDYDVVARNLSKFMRKKSMSDARLSEITGLGVTSINYYRRGKAYPTSKALQCLAKGLGIEVGDFFID